MPTDAEGRTGSRQWLDACERSDRIRNSRRFVQLRQAVPLSAGRPPIPAGTITRELYRGRGAGDEAHRTWVQILVPGGGETWIRPAAVQRITDRILRALTRSVTG